MDAAGSFLIVFTRGDGIARVDLRDAGALDVAVSRFAESGHTRDELLHLTTVEGAAYRVLASEVTAWLESTPAGRLRASALDAALEEEKAPEWGE